MKKPVTLVLISDKFRNYFLIPDEDCRSVPFAASVLLAISISGQYSNQQQGIQVAPVNRNAGIKMSS